MNMLNPVANEKSWEYIFFDRQLNDEQVDFLLKMKLRKHYYVKDLTKLTGKDLVETAKFVDDICQVGILEYCSAPDGEDMVQLPVFAPGAMETTVMTKERSDAFPEMAPAFLNYVLDLQKKISSFVPMGNALMRAIPLEKAIEHETRKVKYEEISYWLDKAGDSIAVVSCECRKLRVMVDEGTGDLEGDYCINLGHYAESCIRMGKARRITRQEAEEIIKVSEKRGVVHQLSNIDGKDFSLFICNCRWDTCMALKTSWYTQSPNLSSSNYVAHVDKEKCVACGGCVEVCPQNAVKLGQKLCEKLPTKIHNKEIPNNHLVFGPKHWQPDFLTNRDHGVPETGTAPCKTNCPAHISVQGYLKKAAQGKYDEALAIIKKENPFPAICGRVCSRYCEQVCTRGDIDSPVAIDEVKRFIAERELKKENRYLPDFYYEKGSGEKIAIIGAGPAGLSCAYYLAVYGHQVTVFDKNPLPGGMMQYGIPSFRLEKDIVQAEVDVLKQMGVEIKCDVHVGKDITLDDLREEGYKGFYVAIGAQGSRKLNVEGENADGVYAGVDFLKKHDSDLGRVVVIGGSNVAIDCARVAIRNANATVMVSLEKRNELPASEEEVEEALHDGVTTQCGWGPKEILARDGKVTGIVLKRCTQVKNNVGRFNPIFDKEDTLTLECDTIVTAIGQTIIWDDLLKGSNVEVLSNGTAKADNWTYQTGQEDIFVGGDVYTGPRFAIDAIAAGKEGAESLHRFVNKGHSLTLGRVRRDNFKYLDKNNIEFGDYDYNPRQRVKIDETKYKTNQDERGVLTEEQIKIETSRCLGCGAARIDPNICIGCGLCTTRCKFDAIHLSRDHDAFGVTYEKLVPAVLKEVGSKTGKSIISKLKKD
jgi:NADPH-dependent glutamate synthase beta subunit-like oxidoreductase/NAD-dependent dihydropyrimidine dehydrogenase PreA subunit